MRNKSVRGICHSGSNNLREKSSMPPGLKNNEPEKVFPLGTHTLSTGTHHAYIYLATQITERHSEHWHKHSSNGFNLLLSLAEHDGDMTVGIYITSLCICTVWVPQAAGLLHPAWPVAVPRSQSYQLLTPAHVNPHSHSTIVLFQLLMQIITHTHTHTESFPGSIDDISVLSPLEGHRCSLIHSAGPQTATIPP